MSNDALKDLVAERGDEIPPAWLAFIGLVRFWLGLGTVLGSVAVIGVAIAAMAVAYGRFGQVGLAVYFLIAMPVTAGIVVGVRRLKGWTATKVAFAIRARLQGIGGSLTPASFSLGPRRRDEE